MNYINKKCLIDKKTLQYTILRVKCECGGDVVKTTHSTWCIKYKGKCK